MGMKKSLLLITLANFMAATAQSNTVTLNVTSPRDGNSPAPEPALQGSSGKARNLGTKKIKQHSKRHNYAKSKTGR